jgi:hypothetical protein
VGVHRHHRDPARRRAQRGAASAPRGSPVAPRHADQKGCDPAHAPSRNGYVKEDR